MPIAGIFMVALFNTVQLFVPTRTISELREPVFELIQKILPSRPAEYPLIIDITGIPQDTAAWPALRNPSIKHPRSYSYTSRVWLDRLIRKIAAQKPAAIGVDIDMSPVPSGQKAVSSEGLPAGQPVGPNDGGYFANWQRIGCPVFLGVMRTFAVKRDPYVGYLGAPSFDPMAAGIVIPNQQYLRGSPRYVQYLSDSLSTPDGLRHETLGHLMGTTLWSDPRGFLRDNSLWQVHVAATMPTESISTVTRAVDYSAIDAMHNGAVPWKELVQGHVSPKFGGRLVFLGNLEGEAGDQFNVPDRAETFGGVLLHASQAYTIPMPIRETTPLFSRVIDVLVIALTTFLFIFERAAIDRYWSEKRSKPKKEHLQAATYLGALGFCLVLLLISLTSFRLVIEDLALIVIGILVDWGLHHLAHKVKHRPKKDVAQVETG